MLILPDKLNPCKQASGKLGGAIHDTIEFIHDKIVYWLTPAIQCQCCRHVNYRFLKYGLLLLFTPLIPYATIVGLFMVFSALAFRIVEKTKKLS